MRETEPAYRGMRVNASVLPEAILELSSKRENLLLREIIRVDVEVRGLFVTRSVACTMPRRSYRSRSMLMPSGVL